MSLTSTLPWWDRVKSCHGRQRQLHRQEDGNDDYEHHGGAVGVPLSPVPLLFTEAEHWQPSECERDKLVCPHCHKLIESPLCLRRIISLYLPTVPLFCLAALFFLRLLFVLLIVSLLLLCSALLMAENKRMLRMTSEMQGNTCTNITRNLSVKLVWRTLEKTKIWSTEYVLENICVNTKNIFYILFDCMKIKTINIRSS